MKVIVKTLEKCSVPCYECEKTANVRVCYAKEFACLCGRCAVELGIDYVENNVEPMKGERHGNQELQRL